MAVTIPLTAEEAAVLAAQAKAQGVSVDSLVRQAVLRIISDNTPAQPEEAEKWEEEFREWLDGIPDLNALSDEGLSRESIYTREDEWR